MKTAPFAAAALIVASLGAVSLAQPEAQPNRRVQVQVDRLMQNDQNNDSKLTREELPARLADRIFEAADADADGALTREELEAHFANRGGPGGARPAAPATPATPGEPSRNDHDAFEGAMKQAGGAVRALRRSGFGEETRDSDLDAAQSIQEAMVLAKATFGGVTPSAQAAEKYGDDAEAYRRDFRLAVIETMRAALDLEEAVLKGDTEGARAAHERMMASQKTAHDLFQDE
jgi:hypothetical protein